MNATDKAFRTLKALYLLSLIGSVLAALFFLVETEGFYGNGPVAALEPCSKANHSSGADDDSIMITFLFLSLLIPIRIVRWAKRISNFELLYLFFVGVWFGVAFLGLTCADFGATIFVYANVSLAVSVVLGGASVALAVVLRGLCGRR